jgi:soluble lytic murein transglycosylase
MSNAPEADTLTDGIGGHNEGVLAGRGGGPGGLALTAFAPPAHWSGVRGSIGNVDRTAARGVLKSGIAGLPLWVALIVAFSATAAAGNEIAMASPVESAISEDLLERPGVALRVAREALEQREFRPAEALLEAIASRHPLVADHADLLRMRARVESGRSDAAIGMRAAWEARDSPLDAAFFTLLGRAHAAKGDEVAARAAWGIAAKVSTDREQIAALRASLASSWERSGERERAAEEYLEVWTHYPWSEPARVADEALGSMREPLEEPRRGARRYSERGDAFFDKRSNEEALDAYDRALALGGLKRDERLRVARQRADTLFRLRRYPEAAAAYTALPQDDKTRIEKARSHARSGDVPRAIHELESIGAKARSAHAPRANLLAGLLAEGEGEDEHERAEAFFEKALGGRSRTVAAAAGWRLGWSRYRAKRFAEAIEYFERLIIDDDAPSTQRARYWRARALDQNGANGAEDEYRALATEYPLAYYGFRSAARVRSGEVLDPEPLDPGSSQIEERDLMRARILLEAGMLVEARAELGLLYPRVRGRADRLNLAQLYADSGDFFRPELLMIEGYGARLAGLPAPVDLEVWWHAWPTPFVDLFREVAERGIRVEPGLVYAVMREESGYRPEVVSISGARGLLQIMPETGERLAQRESLEAFSPDDLFIPSINIQLGSAYLEQLMTQFDGRRSAAIASYNAGPEAVSGWLAEGPFEDDEWVEAIPYDQTREYVKRVLRSLQVYRALY